MAATAQPDEADCSALLVAAEAAIRRGDLAEAYDCASRAHELRTCHRAAYWQVLALARMGDTETAIARYADLDLAADPHIDSRTLAARLQKDRAFASAGAGFAARVGAAAEAYAVVFAATHDPFPGINAASLQTIAGNAALGRALAQQVLARLPGADTHYYSAATRAEALLLIGQDVAAAEALAAGLLLPDANLADRATTLLQLDRLASFAQFDSAGTLRSLLALPGVANWCGHMFREDATAEAAITSAVTAAIGVRRLGIGYGAIAAGSDIVIAEAFLALDLEVNIVLPFAVSEFFARSVDPAGPGWRARAEAVLSRARSLRIASILPDLGDAQAFSHGSRVAMGVTRLRAADLNARACQIAVWDRGEARGLAGTGVDVATWRAAGLESIIIDPGSIDRNFDRGDPPPAPDFDRAPRAILFGDVKGFSKLGERDLPQFWTRVMGRIGAQLAALGPKVVAANSWGDAVFAVIDDTAAAAALALDLQDALGSIPVGDAVATLRLGAHHGIVYHAPDPITGRPNCLGTEVNRAARIEPITPPGAVYATEAFAAALALDAPDVFACRYVGRVATHKNFGTFPMYRLTRRPATAAP